MKPKLAWTVIWSAIAAMAFWRLDASSPVSIVSPFIAALALCVYLVSLWLLCRLLAPNSKATAVVVLASNLVQPIGLLLAAAAAWKALRQRAG